MNTQHERRLRTIRRAGLLCFFAAMIGAASGVFLAFIQPAVPENQWSYPLDVTAFTAIQVWFALQHVGLLLGLFALRWAGALGQSNLGHIGHLAAVTSMIGFAVTELVAIVAAQETKGSPLVGIFGAAYGVFSIVLGAALVVEGIAVLRARVWQGWQRWIPLALGMWVFVPLLPALALSFLGARLAIAGWMLLFAALGWVLMGHAGRSARKNPELGFEGRGNPSLANPAS